MEKKNPILGVSEHNPPMPDEAYSGTCFVTQKEEPKTVEELATKEAESRWTPQPGKHWIRTLRNERVRSFVLGAEWYSTQQNTALMEALEKIANHNRNGMLVIQAYGEVKRIARKAMK